jgi:predicted PurR-regulated permease PerM
MIIVLLSLFVVSCGVVEMFTEMNQQTNNTAGALKRTLDTRLQIGWNIQNGVLTDVNVYFENIDDTGISVGEFLERVQAAVTENIEKKLARLVISVAIVTN